MRLPARLLKRNKNSYKNQYGHVLVLGGSPSMLGAVSLTGLAAMRSGAGLTTVGIPRSLNLTLQKKLSAVIMTLPLPETRKHTFSLKAFDDLTNNWNKYSVVAIGPGISLDIHTQGFIFRILKDCPLPMVIDADALNVFVQHPQTLVNAKAPRVLTPHTGEFSRLIRLSKDEIQKHRQELSTRFAKMNNCVLLLKGFQTIVASPNGKLYLNKTGNPGMATAGCGDVLTGIIASFMAQGLSAFDAARFGAFVHGRAGDIASRKRGELGLIAEDLIDCLACVLR